APPPQHGWRCIDAWGGAACDNCAARRAEVRRCVGAEARALLRAVRARGGRTGLVLVLELLRGGRSARISAKPWLLQVCSSPSASASASAAAHGGVADAGVPW
ncbi:MAG: hypothetical protein VX181_19995, partial [Pseudomonadota bacterium]|nr:hypothetical protein [Pseudomonadota bacterium]